MCHQAGIVLRIEDDIREDCVPVWSAPTFNRWRLMYATRMDMIITTLSKDLNPRFTHPQSHSSLSADHSIDQSFKRDCLECRQLAITTL
jgi:hypothetical protein